MLTAESEGDGEPLSDGLILITPAQARFQSWVGDVLIYVVVINLFVEHAPAVIIESFTMSLFTALVLKLMLDCIMGVEHRVSTRLKARDGARWRVIRLFAVWAILFVSKFAILEVTNFIFGDRVTLGSFVHVMVLVLAMVLAREAISLVYQRVLGPAGRFAPKGAPIAR